MSKFFPLSKGQTARYWSEIKGLVAASKSEDQEELRQDLHRRAAEICTHDRGARCEACTRLLTQERISLKDFDRRHGFDQLLAAFAAILRPSDLNAQLHQINQVKKRKMWRVQSLKNALAAMGHHADRYAAALLQDRFRGQAVEELSDKVFAPYGKSDLDLFIITLSARVNSLRKSAGLTNEQLRAAVEQNRTKQPRE